MFDEIEIYENKDHFFYKKGNSLEEQSIDVPDLPGVYYIYRLANGRVDLVYIGKSGSILQSGNLVEQMLRSSIINMQDGMKRQEYFDEKMDAENIDGLDIYWYVTMDKNHNDLPEYIAGMLMQTYFDVHGKLPPWNKSF